MFYTTIIKGLKYTGISSISISMGNDQSQATKPEPNLPSRGTMDQEIPDQKKVKTKHQQI
jgi:hypothetical protein